MALDGAFLSRLRREIEQTALDARVDKIAQPARDEIVMSLRWRGGGEKLLISAGVNGARAHFTRFAPENPKTPPMFCMLLRKHLTSARLQAVRQHGSDRVLFLDFETRNDFGDPVTVTVVVEIMGRHSNVIVINGDGLIIDSIRRVDFETSSVRQVLPGMEYALPPAQDKLDLFEADTASVLEKLEIARDKELSKALMDSMQGVSPLVCREIAHFANRGFERTWAEMNESARERLEFYLSSFLKTVREDGGVPTMVLDPAGKPKDFSFIPINQYGAAMMTREYENWSELLDAFYARREQLERMKQRSSDLFRVLVNASERITRKLANQREELKECAERDKLRIKAELINVNLHTLKKGDIKAVVPNYYDPDGGEAEIDLDVRLTPSQNSQRYYALYRKADTAEKMLGRLIVEGEAELAYLDSVLDLLARADSEAELEAIRSELAGVGYVKRARSREGDKPGKRGKPGREASLPPHRYMSSDGFTILSGRNNVQNDRLTKDGRNHDIWLHTQRIPGSHTVIITEGREVPQATIEQACVIAAYNSKARESSRVPVDYTFIRHVRKPNGAKPGMVIYDNQRTVIVDPDEDLAGSIKVK